MEIASSQLIQVEQIEDLSALPKEVINDIARSLWPDDWKVKWPFGKKKDAGSPPPTQTVSPMEKLRANITFYSHRLRYGSRVRRRYPFRLPGGGFGFGYVHGLRLAPYLSWLMPSLVTSSSDGGPRRQVC